MSDTAALDPSSSAMQLVGLGVVVVVLTLVIRRLNRMSNWTPHPDQLARWEAKLQEFQPERRHAKVTHQFEFPAEDGTTHKIYYELYGGVDTESHKTEKVLFIAGLATCTDWWLPQIRFFSQQDRYQICVFDNRGAGWKSTTPKNGPMISTRQMAKDALRLMDHLGWDKAHICGISMGGMIGQQMALLEPNRIASLILNSTYLHWTPNVNSLVFFVGMWIMGFLGSMRKQQVHHFLNNMLSRRYLLEKLQDTADPYTSVTTTTTTTTTTVTDGSGHQTKTTVSITRREAIFESELHCYLARLNPKGSSKQSLGAMLHRVKESELAHALKDVPVFVISGTGDRVIHHSNSLRIHAALCSSESKAIRKLRLFEGAGHKVNGDFCQDEYNRELLSWLDQVSGSQQ